MTWHTTVCRVTPIQGQGQGQGGPNAAKMADFTLCLRQYAYNQKKD